MKLTTDITHGRVQYDPAKRVWVGMNRSGELYEHEDRHVVLEWVQKSDTQDSPSMPELPEFNFEIPVQKKALQWHELPPRALAVVLVVAMITCIALGFIFGYFAK